MFASLLGLLFIKTTSAVVADTGVQHVVAKYIIEAGIRDDYSAFPLNECVNHLSTVAGGLLFGVFKCNNDSTAVILEDYGNDEECTGTIKSTTEVTNNTDMFSCTGKNSYHVTHGCRTLAGNVAGADGEAIFSSPITCCQETGKYEFVSQSGCAITKFADGVCFQLADGNYTKTNCNAEGVLSTFYSDAACTQEIYNTTTGSSEVCAHATTALGIAVYTRMASCVLDGNDLNANDVFCTASPTTSPTAATTNPTAMPSVPPTASPVGSDMGTTEADVGTSGVKRFAAIGFAFAAVISAVLA